MDPDPAPLNLRLQRERGGQQGGARNPGVLQGQGEAGGVPRRVSAVGAWWGSRGSRALPHHRCALHGASPLPRDVSVELPFVLMHPKPHDHIPLPRPQTGKHRNPKPLQGGPGEDAPPSTHPPFPLLPQPLQKRMSLWIPTSLSLTPSKEPIPSPSCFDPLDSHDIQICSHTSWFCFVFFSARRVMYPTGRLSL